MVATQFNKKAHSELRRLLRKHEFKCTSSKEKTLVSKKKKKVLRLKCAKEFIQQRSFSLKCSIVLQMKVNLTFLIVTIIKNCMENKK